MAAIEAGRTVAYDRVAACVEAGLWSAWSWFAPSRASCARPATASATPASACRWRRSPRRRRPLAALRHRRPSCSEATTASDRVLTERELVLAEQIDGRSIASADVGERRGRLRPAPPRPRDHRRRGHDRDRGRADAEVAAAPLELIRAWRYAVGDGSGQGGPLPLRARSDAPRRWSAPSTRCTRASSSRSARRCRDEGRPRDAVPATPSPLSAGSGRSDSLLQWGRALARRPRGDPGKGGTRPDAAGTVASYRLQEAAPGGVVSANRGPDHKED